MPADGQTRSDGKNTFADDLIEPLLTIAGGQVRVPTDPGSASRSTEMPGSATVSDDYRVQTPRHLLHFTRESREAARITAC